MRRLAPDEHTRVAHDLDRYGTGFLDAWLRDEDAELWTDDARPPRLFLLRAALARYLAGLGEPAQPTSAGLTVGTMTARGLRLHLEGMHAVATRSRAPRVTLRDKAAQLFLYGRDVLGEGVHRIEGSLSVGDEAFVLNRAGDVLGLGRVVAAPPARGRFLEPVLDRGWYLREGG